MTYIANIRISEAETTLEYTKRSGTVTVHLVEAANQDEVREKILTYYRNKETENVKYEIEFSNIYETIV